MVRRVTEYQQRSQQGGSLLEELISKFERKESKVGIIGLGYVGLPLAIRFSVCGYSVVGFDVDESKIQSLVQGKSYIEHIDSEQVAALSQRGASFVADFTRAQECDALIICVPTPLNKYREPDLGYVTGTVEALLPHLRPGQLMSLESTTYPGTTEEELRTRLERSGFKIGEDFFLIYSPEREDPGNPHFDTGTIPKVVGGVTDACRSVGMALYKAVIDRVVPVSSPAVAEMTKLLENIYRAVNIGLVNEMKLVADRMGIDIFEVIDAAKTKPFGFTAYYPGPGLGGHCIPIDPFYLTWKAREYGLHTRFIELAGEVNRAMPEYVIGKLLDGLNELGKALKNSQILVLGIAYKKNIDDMRESPAVEIMEMIRARGGIVAYSDPHVPTFPKMRAHYFDLQSVQLTAENLGKFDAVVLATDHDQFDYDLIRQSASLIVDSRGKFREASSHIIKA